MRSNWIEHENCKMCQVKLLKTDFLNAALCLDCAGIGTTESSNKSSNSGVTARLILPFHVHNVDSYIDSLPALKVGEI